MDYNGEDASGGIGVQMTVYWQDRYRTDNAKMAQSNHGVTNLTLRVIYHLWQ